VSKIRTKSDWIAAGARAFRELDSPLSRTDDPALIARIRDPKTFAKMSGLADGTVLEPRWVVTERGVMLTTLECASCHVRVRLDNTVEYAAPLSPSPSGSGPGCGSQAVVWLVVETLKENHTEWVRVGLSCSVTLAS
jgi:hypothetical protein